MTDERTVPAGELTDGKIETEAMNFSSIKTLINGGISNCSFTYSGLQAFAQAIIAADRALRTSLAVGDVAMPVVGWMWEATEQDPFFSPRASGTFTTKLVKQSDAQAALATLAAEIARLHRDADEMRQTMAAAAEEIHEHWAAHCDAEGYGPANLQLRLEGRYGVNYPGYTLGAFATLAAERDALLVAAKYAAHIDATPENQLQTMLYDTLTERDALRQKAQENELMAECTDMLRHDLIEAGIVDKTVPPMMLTEAVLAHVFALRKDAERYRWLVHSNWFDDAIMDTVGITNGLGDTVHAAIDAAMTKAAQS